MGYLSVHLGCFMLVVLATSVHISSASICAMKHEVLSASSGSIKSPNFPSSYPLNTTKVWKIVAPKDEKIILQYHTFHLQSHTSQCGVQCGCDYVKVRNKCDDQTPLHTLCGSIVPMIFTSAGDELWVEFRSDHSVNSTGFLALYTLASMSCPRRSNKAIDADLCQNNSKVECCDRNYEKCRYDKLLSSSSGSLASPGYPSNYPGSKTYRWRITVPQGYVVQLNFTTFDTGIWIPNTCANAKVSIKNGPCDYYAGKTFCGTVQEAKLPSFSYISTGRHMFVEFKSYSSSTRKGFQANYRIARQCSGQNPVSCVVNSTASCCPLLYTQCTDSGFSKRSHCPKPKKCCFSESLKPMCCTGRDLKPWSLLITIAALLLTVTQNPFCASK